MKFRTLGRRVAPVAFLALAALAGPARAATPVDPSGTYLTEDGRARVRLEKCGAANDRLCGYVVWLKVPLTDKGEPRVDFKNPDPKKQARRPSATSSSWASSPTTMPITRADLQFRGWEVLQGHHLDRGAERADR